MRATLCILAATTGVAALTTAQTTNVACLNDYYITPAIGLPTRYPPPGTPCDPAAFVNVPGGAASRLTVSTGFPPGSIAMSFFALGPCAPQSACLPPIGCPVPSGGLPCLSNQSIDIVGYFPVGLYGVTMPGACTSVWTASFVFPPALFGTTFSTQTAIVPPFPGCHSPSVFVVTEAFNMHVI